MKILLLCRYFDPEVSGGARRPRALADGLTELGHEVVIAAPKGADFENIIEVPHPSFPVKFAEKESKQRFEISNWLRKALLFPDPEIRWALRLVSIVKAHGFVPDFIISTNPPESLHVAGHILKRHFNCKWVAEFRDPWIYPPQRLELLHNSFRRTIETSIAKYIFKNLDGLVSVSQKVMEDAIKLAPLCAERKIIGHFAQKYSGTPAQLPESSFNIVHTGAISLSNPLSDFDSFLSAFEEFCDKREDAVLYWAGRRSENEVTAIHNSKVRDKIILLGNIDNKSARDLQMGADALLLVSGAKSHALPGKFSEYCLTQKPIIAFGNGEWRKLINSDAFIIGLEDAIGIKKGSQKQTACFDSKQAALEYIDLFEKLF